ncbi:hypothetical protein CTEN210_14584 [Chaetoceros tenuissimus]|uniref:ETS domain-containing protein n=1 Tax=Chaetoceros tenuissimus TaxID=426638 RepID=A0AAD3D5H5_9STRA|nr:hypothetical protein CTEN210_14584 [Chaetoceros tenuissimus]
MSIANENMNNLLFPQKLHKLLDDNLFEEIISWQPHGRSFKVHQKEDFVKKVYPIYFKKSVKYPSFQRQLSYYGFTRQDLPGPDKGGYHHPQFLRGCFSLCTQQVNRHVEREQEEGRGGLKSPQNKGPEPKFYQMTPMPPLPNQKKSRADEEGFNYTTRSHHDRVHPFMMMGRPVPPPSHSSFRSDTRNEYFPKNGHKELYYYPGTTVESRHAQKGRYQEVSDFCCSVPSLSFDHDGRRNYHPFEPYYYHNPYEDHMMVENAIASSKKETNDGSLSNEYYSHDSHNAHFDNYHYTAPVPPARSRNVPTGHSSIPNRPSFGGDEKREDQGSSSRNSNDAMTVSSNIQHKISTHKDEDCSRQERPIVQVEELPSLLPASSTFDDERDPIEPAVAFSSSSSRSLNKVYSTKMVVPAAARKVSNSSLLSMKDEQYKKSREEDKDIFGHRTIEEQALLDEARLCIRESFEWDDTFISSSYSFS